MDPQTVRSVYLDTRYSVLNLHVNLVGKIQHYILSIRSTGTSLRVQYLHVLESTTGGTCSAVYVHVQLYM